MRYHLPPIEVLELIEIYLGRRLVMELSSKFKVCGCPTGIEPDDAPSWMNEYCSELPYPVSLTPPPPPPT